MKLKAKNISILFLASIASILVFVGVWMNYFKVKADVATASLQSDKIQSSYILDEELIVPTGKFEYDGKEYPADVVVHFPSGNAYLSESVKLTETGIYTLEYRTIINGELVKKYETFETLKSLYSVGSARSTMTYGQPKELGINYTTNESPAGLCVSLANGDVFSYNKAINLNDSAKNKQAIKLYLTPQKSKVADAFALFVKFTDVYDPNNFAIVSIWSYNMKSYEDSPCRAAYVTTCVPSIGQNYTGHYNTYQAAGPGWVDVIFKSMRTSGFCSFMSFYGDNANGAVTWKDGTPGGSGFNVDWGYAGYQQLGFWWNYSEKQIFSNQPVSEFSELLADYDSPQYYSSLWDGFTTGECYVSIWAEDYNNTSFNFVVTEVDGFDLSANEPETTFKDVDAPVINVDYGKYTEIMYPDACIGCKYPIFSAYGKDGNDGDVEVYSRVFYGYGTDKCYEISSDDTFIPEQEGEYTIVYTSKDRANNKSEKTVKVSAKKSAMELVFQTDVQNAEKVGMVGVFVEVPESIYEGGVGDLTYSVIAINKDSGKIYDATEGKFRPMEAGTYEVICKVKDFIGQEKQEKYEVVVSEAKGVLFNELPNLPHYFISGYNYILPGLQAENIDTKDKIESSIFIVDNGVETEAIGGIFDIDGEDRNIDVIYRAIKGSEKTDLKFTIPVINVKKGTSIDLGKYFDCKNISAVSDNDKVLLTVDSTKKSGEAIFINPVLAEGFKANFKIEKGGFNELSMYLIDSENPNQSIKFSWKKTTGVAFTYINNRITTVSSTLDFEGINTTNFEWSNTECKYVDNSTALSMIINKTYFGEDFKGFSSGKIYVKFVLEDVLGEAAISISQINNQTIRTTRRDVIVPQSYLEGGDYVAQINMGEKLNLKNIFAADVLSPTVSITLTVVDPDGAIVTTIEGTKLDNAKAVTEHILFKKPGLYQISYLVSDGTKEQESMFSIECILENRISMEVNAQVPVSGTVNTKISLPSATASSVDNSKTTIYILVINPNGIIANITSDASFTPKSSGSYKVLYAAYDASGNVCLLEYTIVVK